MILLYFDEKLIHYSSIFYVFFNIISTAHNLACGRCRAVVFNVNEHAYVIIYDCVTNLQLNLSLRMASIVLHSCLGLTLTSTLFQFYLPCMHCFPLKKRDCIADVAIIYLIFDSYLLLPLFHMNA